MHNILLRNELHVLIDATYITAKAHHVLTYVI